MADSPRPQTALLTVGQVADMLAEPEWRIRRIVDRLAPDVPRAGQYRLIPRGLVPQIVEAIDRPGIAAS